MPILDCDIIQGMVVNTQPQGFVLLLNENNPAPPGEEEGRMMPAFSELLMYSMPPWPTVMVQTMNRATSCGERIPEDSQWHSHRSGMGGDMAFCLAEQFYQEADNLGRSRTGKIPASDHQR